jgi:secreted trypsin-like serine protease
MPASLSDREHQTLIRELIKSAETDASSDAEFVRLLRERYFAQRPGTRAPLPTIQGARARMRSAPRAAAAKPADLSFHIYEDPRFLQNARALAQRAVRRMRVIGGSRVTGANFADCVAVGNDDQFGCTGTLIAKKVVVTAGHCAKFATRVFFGNDVTGNGKSIAVKERTPHPKYHKSQNNDLMVLTLERPATVTPRVLADGVRIDAATDGRAVGFGNVDATGTFGYGTKRQVDVPIASVACSGKVAGQKDTMAYGCDLGLELVAGKPMLGKDSCSGDSGGPFYVSDGRNGWLLAGATSRATKSAMASCGDGGIYVRLDKYREWIEDVTGVKLPVAR